MANLLQHKGGWNKEPLFCPHYLIIIDAAVRDTLHQIYGDGININNSMIQFYADDGIILGEKYEIMQQIIRIGNESGQNGNDDY